MSANGENARARTILSALLDYYSDKASNQASAIVATAFGLFGILTVSGHRPWIFCIYWSLWFAGWYFLMGFTFWAAHEVWTKSMLTGRIELRPDENIGNQIENRVRDQWKKTFLRNLYCYVKFSRARERGLSFRRWICEREEQNNIMLGDFLPFLFLILGLMSSSVFFPQETGLALALSSVFFRLPATFSSIGTVFSSVLLFLFCLDVVSIVRHRRWKSRSHTQETELCVEESKKENCPHDSLRTEYDMICRYRLEWARTGHNYGWIAIPASFTVPALLFGIAVQHPLNRIVLKVGTAAIWMLLLFWRVVSHQIDNQIRLLYPRAIEIEEELGIQFTRIWLRNQWKLDHLPTKEEALARAAKRVDFSRGHLLLDLYAGIYFLITLAILVLW